jgi:flagellar basal-body rod modification protein FlgD
MSDVVAATAVGEPVSPPAPVNPSASLGQDAFLRLLVAELQHQNPLEPMSQGDFMGQLAQFSTLERITALGETLDRLAFAAQASQAVSLIGRTIVYEGADGAVREGVVDAVSFQEGGIRLQVGSEQVPPAAVRSVRE